MDDPISISELKAYILSSIRANKENRNDGIRTPDFYDGANDALEELAVAFHLVEGYGEIERKTVGTNE